MPPGATPPVLSDDARRAALARAAEVRQARAELKVDLKAGKVTLAEVLERAGNDDVVGKLKVLVVVESLPGVGKVRARRAMADIGIAENRRLRGLGDLQRARLLEAFGG